MNKAITAEDDAKSKVDTQQTNWLGVLLSGGNHGDRKS